jgi:hypothetical protein
MEPSRREARSLIWETVGAALVLSAFTGMGYLCVWYYSDGYLDHFAVSHLLIQISVLDAIGVGVLAAIIPFLLFLLLLAVPALRWKGLVYQSSPVVFMIILWTAALSSLQTSRHLTDGLALALSTVAMPVLVLRFLIRPLLQRDGPILDRMQAEMDSRPLWPTWEGTSAASVHHAFRVGGLPIMTTSVAATVFALLSAFAFRAVGDRQFQDQVDFTIVDSANPCVLVEKYGDELVCAELAKSQRVLSGTVVLLKLEPGHPLRTRRVHLGHLLTLSQ